MRPSHRHSPPESRRLLFALLISLALHIFLLFFVRFAPPSWKDFSGATSPLNVTLNTKPDAVAKPSAIAVASQDSQGSARVGAQDSNRFPESPLAAATATPVEHPRTDIPQAFIGKDVLTAKKSTRADIIKNEPDLLATKIPAPENPDNKDKPYAPAAGVAKPVTVAAAPSAEKLVGAEPVPGERQEKIIFTEPAQAKAPEEKPGTLPVEAKVVKPEKPEPVKIEEPQPVKIEQPNPVELAQAKPVEIEQPKPVELAKPVKIDEPKPAKVAEPLPPSPEQPKPAQTEEAKPARTELAAEHRARPAAAEKSDIFRNLTSAYKIPSLAELSIASAGKLADDGRKIKFGERRKTVGVREQDFRYAMYVESVRLKLQRIGRFNYPAAAARDNLSGTLSVIITLRADGSLEEFSVIQPSVYAVLNKGAENIVRMSAPFSPFPDNIRQETDVLSIRINWTFSNSDQMFD